MSDRVILGCALAFCALVGVSSSAEAQSFRLNRFRSAERPDDSFGVRRLNAFGHLRFGANAVIDYANDPLVIKRNHDSRSELAGIVDHQLTLKLDLSLTLWDRLMLLAGFDAPLLMKGPKTVPGNFAPRADGAGFGDVSLGARLRLVGDADDVFGLGLQAALILPTSGSDKAYSGEEGVSVRPELIAEVRTKPVRITANAGALVRDNVRMLGRVIGDELVYGLGLGVPLHQRFELLGELRGGFDFKHFGAKNSTGIEWLVGGKANTASGFYFGAGAGTGMMRGIGSPDVRVIGQLGYLTPLKNKDEPKKEPVEETPADRDHDGIPDASDACPDKPEDKDGFQDEDGCPDPDNDGDGVPDTDDNCASEPEDKDGFEDADGCPDPDNDGDSVLDVDDACPNEAGRPDNKGCPSKVVEEGTSLMALEQIQFENNKDTILEQSFPVLETVQKTLDEHPEIKTIRVEGHTDGVGQPAYNMRLSRARTQSVLTYLTSHGVPAKKLQAYACGELHPIADDTTEEGRFKNRRVEFRIIDPAPEGQDTKPKKGCVKVK